MESYKYTASLLDIAAILTFIIVVVYMNHKHKRDYLVFNLNRFINKKC